MKQNRGKIGYYIQAVLKVVSVPARFWERGAHCFVVRFTLGLEEAAAFFGRKVDSGISLQERDTQIVYAVRMAVNRVFPAAAGSKCHAVEGSSRLFGVRGERLSGSVMKRSLATTPRSAWWHA